jgi:TIR domain
MFDGGTVGRAIFISYRRDDTEGEAGRLYDDLARTFGEDSVFMDVAGINPGMDFRKAIDDNVATCGVLLAMIGPNWATIANSAGERRLDDPNDFVRLEVGSALARNIAVIPVLVHDAKMPRPEHLPDNLKDLAYRNNVEITHARWNSDVQLLTKVLGQYVSSSSATNTEPVHATVPVQLPPPNAPALQPATAKSSALRRSLLCIIRAAWHRRPLHPRW